MRRTPFHSLLLALAVIALSWIYLSGLRGVPYHPDESTQIFMSSDVPAFFRDPGSLFWQPQLRYDLRQHYREMDAPLTRYLIGAARWAAGLPEQKVDWDWTRNWESNRAVGALPDDLSLWVSRLAAAGLFPFSLLLVYVIGRALGGRTTGWTAMLLFAGNALVLLHTRRAMAESALVLTTLLSVWAVLALKRRVWLIALPLALAFNAKQSAGLLILPGIAALLWQPGQSWKQILCSGLLFALLFAAVTVILNPFLWQHPIPAALSAWQARADFTRNMAAAITRTGAVLPGSFAERLVNELYQVFFAAPSIAETANYTRATLASETAYFANPLHGLLRGTAGGGLMLVLTLMGMLLAILKLFRPSGQERRTTSLLLLATLAQILILAWIVTIPWQRYYLAVIPLVSLWSAYALSEFGRRIVGARHNDKPVLVNSILKH